MNSSLKKICLGTVALAAMGSGLSFGQEKTDGYVVDGRGAVAKNPFGLCWRTAFWTPAQAIAECDPDLVKKPAPAPAPAPAPMAAPAPAPEPEAKPVPAKMLPQKINFAADALFDFDKAVLKDDGKAMLDDLARTLDGAKYEVILAIGHTDRIGSAAYNKKLSLRRAEAAKKYLVSKGIAPNKIYVDGKGEADPMTKPGDCKGKTGKSLIACLQPDRRVDVEVVGEKEVK